MNEDWHEIIQSLHVKTLFLNTCVAMYFGMYFGDFVYESALQKIFKSTQSFFTSGVFLVFDFVIKYCVGGDWKSKRIN